MCGFCNITNVVEEPLNLFSEEDIDRILTSIYYKYITKNNLDVQTYLTIARKLLEGVDEGYRKQMQNVLFDSEDYIMLKSLRDNTYMFSAAKTYQQTKEMSSLITGKSGINPFSEFKKQAREVFDKYNENYLRAEYNSAIAQSRSASQWQEITKQSKFLPMLTYVTAGDGRVRPQHEILNNTTKPVGDAFWNKFYPPNGWNCRCTVLQSSDEKETDLPKDISIEDVPPIFRFNAGKEKIVFSKKHPYFTHVPRDDRDFARDNFGLPI